MNEDERGLGEKYMESEAGSRVDKRFEVQNGRGSEG